MIGYRRKSFYKAHKLLDDLRADKEKLEPLVELQRLLVDEIEIAEIRIRELKQKVNLLGDESSPSSERRRRHLTNRIDGLRQTNFIWRSFGDAIAFLYLSKFSLKQTHYNTKNSNPKQSAGFIGGKAGMATELALVERAISNGIPALLVDVTNTIRYGDVCLMADIDPYLIEVKAGSKLNTRGRKQVKNINKIHDFLEKDVASELRGFKEIRRVSHQKPERSYETIINACIERAVVDGFAIEQPEQGLHYVVIRDEGVSISELFSKLKCTRPWVFSLNLHKSNRDWAPYVPFTLTIKSALRLYEFLRGNIYILVVIDLDVLTQSIVDRGFAAEINFDDEDFPLKISKHEDAVLRVSSHFIMRVGLEFVSLSWTIDSAIESFLRNNQNKSDG